MRFMTVLLLSVLAVPAVPAVASSDQDLRNCEERYEKAAGPFTRHNLNGVELVPHAGDQGLLSYRGKAARSFDGTRFNPLEGVLKLSVQELAAQDKLTQLNAAMVYEFLTTADNDADYPEVQFMALQLQPKFPRVKELDWILYWVISGNPNAGLKMDLPFCKGRLWTYKQVQEWFTRVAIPKAIAAEPELVGETDVCTDKIENGQTVLVCSQD